MNYEYRKFAREAKKDGYDLNKPADAVALAAFVVGPNVRRIAAFLGKPVGWCAEPARVLREQGCWSGSKIVIDGDEVDGVEIAMHCLVAEGMLERVPA